MSTIVEQRGEPQTRPLSSTLKILSLLDAIASSSNGVRIAELARLMGSSRGTVYQQLVTLMAAGWMERMEDGRYCLTLRAAHIGHAALEQASLGERIIPALGRLVEALNCTVSVAILDKESAVIVQRVEPGRVLRADLRVGTRLPISLSATGRVLVAYSSDEDRALLSSNGVVLPEQDDIDDIRAKHFAIALYMAGVSAIAAPIFSAPGRCIAALAVSAAPGYLDPQQASAALLSSAAEVSRLVSGKTFGFQP
jgi:DNA-binding IclR family transcriptional regulator